MSREWYEIAFGELYPEVYAHRDEAEAERVARRLAPLLRGHTPVLDVACGSGRYAAAFEALGFNVVGGDLSDFLLADAVRTRGLGGRLVRCDMRALPFATAAVGAAINMFTSFGYFDTDLDNVRVIQEVGRVLKPGGVFLLDFINAAALNDSALGTSRRSAGEAVIDEVRRIEDDGRVLSKRVVFRPASRPSVEYVERVRLYRLEDLTTMVESAGMAVSGVFGDYDLAAFGMDSPRLILHCERGSA